MPDGFYSCDIRARLIARESGPGARLGRFTPLDVAYVGLKAKRATRPGRIDERRFHLDFRNGRYLVRMC